MSSTGRSDNRSNHNDDHHITPRWAIREFLREWDVDTGIPSMLAKNPDARVLDPCAGGMPQDMMAQKLWGAHVPEKQWNEVVVGRDWTLMPYEEVLRESWGIKAQTMDIRADAPRVDLHADYLTYPFPQGERPFDLIISNPPFSLIREFIERSLHLLPFNGYLAFLLRLNYFGSQKRARWFQSLMPEYAYVHSRRMSFDPISRRTDSIEYMHAVWRKGYCPAFTKLQVIVPGNDIEF